MSGVRDVKGEAIEASPSCTTVLASASSSRASMPPAFFFFRFLSLRSPSPSLSRRPTPTCAAFKAPTSFVPSPHISTVIPRSFSTPTMASFCSGDVRANTLTRLIRASSSAGAVSSWAAIAAARASPPMHSTNFFSSASSDLASRAKAVDTGSPSSTVLQSNEG